MKLNYFNFKNFKNGYLITNEQGKYCFLNQENFLNLVEENYTSISPELLVELKNKYFIYDMNEDVFIEKAIYPYRDNKQYIFAGTCLHIFVLTNACNMNCVYCQAQDSSQEMKGIMSFETAQKAVDIALQSPENNLTFEFQGGEPLINFETIRYIVKYSQENKNDKNIKYSLVTNTLLLTDEMIRFFSEYEISVSTSLDGDRWIHNTNRPMRTGAGTFDIVSSHIKRLQEAGIHIGAIQTTTKESLKNPEAIVRTYCDLDLKYLFIRPLTPLGYAKEHWDEIGYRSEEFIHFYQQILNLMIDYNRKGIHMIEGHASIFLKKILAGYSDNYMELRSPCGAAIGQMAYYYDGNIYTCDEGRMVAEMGDPAFCLGNVDEKSYDDLIESRTCKITCQASVLETLPSCCDCVYHSYCGVCPVINYASDHNIYERQSDNYRCRIYKGMLDTIFTLLYDDKEVFDIFKTWI